MSSLFDRILEARGLIDKERASFLLPDYSKLHDPFLLPDMTPAVKRLIKAKKKQEKVVIYGDYDIDGLTATALLLDALGQFEFEKLDTFIPNRFVEGYGLNKEAIAKIASDGTTLIITVDSGSSSVDEVKHAKKLGVDIIVTDHHNISGELPNAVAVINPKRSDSKYPFADLAGVGVAFKLVQALQTKLDGLNVGHEKWLLDLVALGTVCDVVELVDENRTLVYFGLKVLEKTKRVGLKALMAVSQVDIKRLDTRSLGFRLGPRMNAAGRLETAKYALDLLVSGDSMDALKKAEQLEKFNKSRRLDQDKIMRQAIEEVKQYSDDDVLVLSHKNWNHGIVGIVASKLMEKYQKPVFVFEEIDEEAKGSGRSFGDFSAVDLVNECRDIIKKGGGHKLAAGVTLPKTNIKEFRKRANGLYKTLNLKNQEKFMQSVEDVIAGLDEITEDLFDQIKQLEPFGMGNTEPILMSENLTVTDVKRMGDSGQHLKLELLDSKGNKMKFISFNSPTDHFVEVGENVSVWYKVSLNEWRGERNIEGMLVRLETIV